MQADPFTRKVMKEIDRQVVERCPEFYGAFEPMCFYRGGRCTEFNCCGFNKNYRGGEIDE
jgi:hypothetical protein